jgi:tetraacyldisaccharide 4'-kinase
LLDLLYAQAVGARRRWFERHPDLRRRLSSPVISVGNLSVGGTGKTPLVAYLAQQLLARGERPAILSRGYRRHELAEGVVVVSDGHRTLEGVDRAGDEPLMLARMVPDAIVAVCEERYLAGALAESRLGATVHVLDDGFQHVQLARDLDILVTRCGEIGQGRVLPFGRLRESAAAAARADLVVVMDADEDAARSEAWELGISQFAAVTRKLGATGATGAAGAVGAVFAVAGIGQPERFFAMLREAGYRVAGTMAFRDHHRYDGNDAAKIAAAARQAGADAVVTTAKDAVRFERIEPLPFTLMTIEMSLDVKGEALGATMVEALARARGKA